MLSQLSVSHPHRLGLKQLVPACVCDAAAQKLISSTEAASYTDREGDVAGITESLSIPF